MTKVLIIGGGVAGLSAGSYLQMNGYDTEIFELNSNAGGLCVSWKRKAYTIDGCVHWLIGGNPKDPFYTILNGLIDMKNLSKITYEEFCSVEEGGRTLRFFGDLDKLEMELKGVSPQDGKMIEEMISGAKEIASIYLLDAKSQKVMDAWEKAFNAWKMPISEYAQNIKSTLIRKLLFSIPLSTEYLMFHFLVNAASFHHKTAFYPEGGAEGLVDKIVHRYVSLGGKIHYKSPVAKICVENGCAKGIRLRDGKTHTADYIISAADWRHTVHILLDGRYIDEHVKKFYFDEKYIPRMTQFYVSLGVARKFDNSFKPYVCIALKNPLKLGKDEITDAGITIHNFDPTAAPSGKTVLTMAFWCHDAEYWVKLRNENRAQYDQEKKRIASHMIDEIDAHFGDVKDKVEMIDVASPATYVRYTNNWNGSCCGWQNFSAFSSDKPKNEIKGLERFFMCGQWVGDAGGGGISGSAQSGRDLAQILCERDGKKFKALTFSGTLHLPFNEFTLEKA
jgi:phytoene dehydrogenase-like protein